MEESRCRKQSASIKKRKTAEERIVLLMISLFTKDINEYLKCDAIIDFDNAAVRNLADQLYSASENETDFIRKAYEYVRDQISHSADISADSVTCSACYY